MLDAHADMHARCIDFGCGVGKYLPLLSPRFKTVLGVDISQGLLDKAMTTVIHTGSGSEYLAKRGPPVFVWHPLTYDGALRSAGSRCRKLKNVALEQADLAVGPPAGAIGVKGAKGDFAVCMNALLVPDQKVLAASDLQDADLCSPVYLDKRARVVDHASDIFAHSRPVHMLPGSGLDAQIDRGVTAAWRDHSFPCSVA